MKTTPIPVKFDRQQKSRRWVLLWHFSVVERETSINSCVAIVLLALFTLRVFYYLLFSAIFSFTQVASDSRPSDWPSTGASLQACNAEVTHIGGFRQLHDALAYLALAGLCSIGRLRVCTTMTMLLLLMAVKGHAMWGSSDGQSSNQDSSLWDKFDCGAGLAYPPGPECEQQYMSLSSVNCADSSTTQL